MNAFENIVAQYLESKGYWVRQSVKIHITGKDKKALGKPSMPRPEIDVVALNTKKNELLLVSVKSFFDSGGISYGHVIGEDGEGSWGYESFRLFTNGKYRRIVVKQLKNEFLEKGLINNKTEINYALAMGKFHSPDDETRVRSYFSRRKWKLFSPKDIKDWIKNLSDEGYEDNEVIITAKLILRD